MKDIMKKLKGRGFEDNAHRLKIIASVAAIVLFAVVGLCFFFRPTYSESEKRNLTEFPKFTFGTFLSGEYFSQISLWYSDTYPLRESMINANSSIQSMYGEREDQLIVSPSVDDTIENGGVIEKFDKVWVQKETKTAFEFFNNRTEKNDVYIDAVNTAADKLEGVNVYDMIVPLHYTYRLTDEQIAQVGAPDCVEVINSIYERLDDNVTTLDVHSQLMAHRDEYLYFRTDHHWTARGAYYAYVAFCEAKGITPTPLEDYERVVFEGFVGSFYSWSGKNKTLGDNPDYVEAFIPRGTNLLTDNGTGTEYAIVYKGAGKYDASNKYLCFIGGDRALSTIHNPNIKNGSSIVVIKESYGNAFVPFLVDSYEYVYVIDYRDYNGSLADFVEKNNVDDVLFLNTVSTTASDRSDLIKDLVG